MRKRPKLNAVIVAELKIDEFTAHQLVLALDRAGFDIIEKKTRRRERDSLWRRESEILNAQDEERSVRAWALRIADDLRHLQVRCSFLYHVALDHGAIPDELAHETELETV